MSLRKRVGKPLQNSSTTSATDTAEVCTMYGGVDGYRRPRGDDNSFLTNPRSTDPTFRSIDGNASLHVRCFFPPNDVQPYARLFFHPGSGGGLDDPKLTAVIFEPLARSGLVVIALDPHRHAFSEGTPRGTADVPNIFVDDFVCLASAYDCGRETINELPYFVCGESFGGCISLLTGLRIQKAAQQATHRSIGSVNIDVDRFKGVVAICAAIAVAAPGQCFVRCIDCCCGTCCPTWKVPVPPTDFKEASQNQEDRDYMIYATTHRPTTRDDESIWHRLTYRGGVTLLDLIHLLCQSLHTVSFPFIAIHDPGDKLCKFEGVQRLMDVSKTPPADKKVAQLTGHNVHQLTLAYPEKLVSHVVQWTQSRISGGISQQPVAN
eukprot:m.11290 g.11290  ORF g.11290 m.11290 type:complete len:378 (-) comp8740_c0_seq1:95-1228(-)